jgi:hypothetical protein
MRIELPNGNWAEVKEISDLRRSDRRALNEAIVIETAEGGHAIVRASLEDDMANAVLPSLVLNWSLPLPLPSVKPDVLDLLTLEQDQALREGIQGHINALQGKNAPVPDNAVPTALSAS